MSIKITLGMENFAELREGGYYYVDKTFFIKELFNTQFKVNLITRPRRFGKTLTISMLEDFFDISRDSRTHFEGLAISKEPEICSEWMNQWPVIFLSFKNIDGNNFQTAYGRIKVLIATLCKKYAFLEKSPLVDEDDKVLFKKLKSQDAEPENVTDSLALLTRMMTAHYGKTTILLIDEYDVPLAKAHDNGYYTEMLDVIRALLGASLKTTPWLKFGIVTGCLKISKESIFTGINNLVANTITVNRFDESIGFTEPEVQTLLTAAGLEDHMNEIRTWYDGYRFGNADVYCPWDVLNHAAALMDDPAAEPLEYWTSSSHNEIIYRVFDNPEFDVNSKFETLLSGGCIHEKINEDLTYDTLEASEENLWSLLFMTGYLTRVRDDNQQKKSVDTATARLSSREAGIALRIPNEEIKRIFQKSVVAWFRKNVQKIDRSNIFSALWTGDTETAQKEISDLLFDSISYHDYLESYYHAFVAGLFAGAGYIVESNYEYGNGRPDVVIKEKRNRRVMLFEVKHAGKEETLTHAVKKALNQIKDKRYTEALDGYHTVISYGIAFKGKDCMIEEYRKE